MKNIVQLFHWWKIFTAVFHPHSQFNSYSEWNIVKNLMRRAEGINWEIRIDICTPLYKNRQLIRTYCTAQGTQYSVMASMWKESKKSGYMYDWGWGGWMASLTRWTWVWVNSGRWWWTGRPGVLQSWGLKESDMTEQLNWTELIQVAVHLKSIQHCKSTLL